LQDTARQYVSMERVSELIRSDRSSVLQLTGILDGSDTSAKVGTRYRPAGLSDPDPLARRDTVNRVFRRLH
jgi:hypothetical protein